MMPVCIKRKGIVRILMMIMENVAYRSLGAELLKEALDETDLFQNDQTFSLLALVRGHFQMLLAEQQAI